MLQRFASASAVAAVVVALAAGGLRLGSAFPLEGGYLLTTIWCVVPLAWGLWALLTPRSWLPQRLPLWGALLGLTAGLVAMFVLDLPGQLGGEPVPAWVGGIGVLLAVGVYYLLWFLVRRAYQALTVPSLTT